MNEVKEIVNVKTGEYGTYKVVVEMKPMLLSYHQALHLCGRDKIDVFLLKHNLGNCKAKVTELSSTDSENQISINNLVLTEMQEEGRRRKRRRNSLEFKYIYLAMDGAVIFECIAHKELSLQEAFTLCGEQNVREIFLQKSIALEKMSTPIAASSKSLPGQEKLSHNLPTINQSLQKAAINPCLVEFSMSSTKSFIFPRVQTSTSLTWSDNSTLQFPIMSSGCFENNLPVATNKAAFIPQVPESLSLNIHSSNLPSSMIAQIKPIKQNNCISADNSQLLNKISHVSADKPLLCWTSLSSNVKKQILKNIQATPKNKSSVLLFNSLRSPNSANLKYFSCLTSAASFMCNKEAVSLSQGLSIQPKSLEVQDTYLLNPFTEKAAVIFDPKIQDKLVAKSEMAHFNVDESNPQSNCCEEISQCNYSETVPQLNQQFNKATIQTNFKSKTFYECRYCKVSIAHRLSFLLHENACNKKVGNCSLKSQPFQNTKGEIESNANVTPVITRVKGASPPLNLTRVKGAPPPPPASASLNLTFDDIKPFEIFKGKKLFSESLNFSKVISATSQQTLSLNDCGDLVNENKNLITLTNINTAQEKDVLTPITYDSVTVDLNEPIQLCLSNNVCCTQQSWTSTDLKNTHGFLSTLPNDSFHSNDKLCSDEKEISELVQAELAKPHKTKRKCFSSVRLTEPIKKNIQRDKVLLNLTPNKIDHKDIDFKINVFSPNKKITDINCLTSTTCQVTNNLYNYRKNLYKCNKNVLTFETLRDGDHRKEILSYKVRNIFRKHCITLHSRDSRKDTLSNKVRKLFRKDCRTLTLPTSKSTLLSFHDAFLCKNKFSDNIFDNSVNHVSHFEDKHKKEISLETSKYTRSSDDHQQDGVESNVINDANLDLHAVKTPILLSKYDIEPSQNNDKGFVKRNGASLRRSLSRRTCKKNIPKTIMVTNVPIKGFQHLKVKNKSSYKLSLRKLNLQKSKKIDKKSHHNFCKESPLKESRTSSLQKKKEVSADSIMNRLTSDAEKVAKTCSKKTSENNNLENLFEDSQFQFSSQTVSESHHGHKFKSFFTQQSLLNDINHCSDDLKKIGIKEKKLKSRSLCAGGKSTSTNHLKMLLEESATFSTPRLTGRTRQGREFKAFNVSPFSLKTADGKSINTVHNSLSHAKKNSSADSNDQNEQMLSKTEGSLPSQIQEKPTLKENFCKLNRTSSSCIETTQATFDLKPSSATENATSVKRSSGTTSEICRKTFQNFQMKYSMMMDPSSKTRKGKFYKRFSPSFSPFYSLRNKLGFEDRPNVASESTVIKKSAARECLHYVATKKKKDLRVNALLTSEQLADLAKEKGYEFLT